MPRIIFILLSAAAAAVAAYFGQPYVHNNSDFVVIIVTVFTVFAGFLIAVISIIGDPAMIPEGSWRIAEARRDTIESRLWTHSFLFMVYLITIAFLLGGVLAQGALKEGNPIRVCIERIYLFFGVFSFILSFALPIILMKLQRARIDAEIERRRQSEGIGGCNTQLPD